MSRNLPPIVAQTQIRHIRVCMHISAQWMTFQPNIQLAPVQIHGHQYTKIPSFPLENEHRTLEAYNLPPWCVGGKCIYHPQCSGCETVTAVKCDYMVPTETTQIYWTCILSNYNNILWVTRQACLFIMMIQLMQLILKLVMLTNHPPYGLIAHIYVNTYVPSASMYVTSAKKSMVGWARRHLARHWNLRIYKLHVINWSLSPFIVILRYCNTFVTNVAAAPGYGWSLPLISNLFTRD